MGVLRSLYERIVGRYDPAPVGTGDVLVVSGKAVGRLAANGISDGWVLTRDSAATEGIKWAAPGGAAGDHALLSSLPWAASGHTGTPNRLAVFDGAGAAAYAAIPLNVANGGTGSTTAPDARTALGAADASLGYVTWQSEPDLPGHRALSAQELIEIQLTTDEAQVRVRFGATQRLAGRNTAGAGAGEELTVHQALDWVTTTRGALLFRGSAEWQPRIPVAAVGHVLTNQGVGADPTWASISTALDVLSSTRGAVLYRGASSWLALAPGTAGHVLTTQGAGADPSWQAAGGGGGGLSQAQILSRASLRA